MVNEKQYKVNFFMVSLVLFAQYKQASEVLNHGLASHGQGDHLGESEQGQCGNLLHGHVDLGHNLAGD